MAREFGKRRPTPIAQATRQHGHQGRFLADLPIPPIEPMQLLHGAGYCLLGYFLGMSLFGTLLAQPKPEFLRFVYVPADTRAGLITESFDDNRPKIMMPGEN